MTYEEILKMYQGNTYQADQYWLAQSDKKNKTGLYSEESNKRNKEIINQFDCEYIKRGA